MLIPLTSEKGYCLVVSVYLSSLPVAHLSNTPKTRLLVTGDSARIQGKTTESSAWFFSMLGVYHRHTGPRFKVSSERLLVILEGQHGDSNPQPVVTRKHCVHESYTLPTELYWLTKNNFVIW